MDFFKCLENDMLLAVMKRLDNPADLVRASIVSRHWGDFVISNELCKKLCVRKFPQVANHVDVGSSEGELHSRNHKVFASLLYALQRLKLSSPSDCIEEAFSSSSANSRSENVSYTLREMVVFGGHANWSSKGRKDPNIPETLIYKLKSELCLVSEIDIMPYGDQWWNFQKEPPYSAKFVRFRMGFPKAGKKEFEENYFKIPDPADDHFVWEYTSPLFEMAQDEKMQKFKFPEPVLCIGGFVMIELLGRVQKKVADGLYYIKIAKVKILGRSLNPAFDAEVQDSSGKFILRYDAAKLGPTIKGTAKGKRPDCKRRMRHEEGPIVPPPHLRGMF